MLCCVHDKHFESFELRSGSNVLQSTRGGTKSVLGGTYESSLKLSSSKSEEDNYVDRPRSRLKKCNFWKSFRSDTKIKIFMIQDFFFRILFIIIKYTRKEYKNITLEKLNFKFVIYYSWPNGVVMCTCSVMEVVGH